MEGFHSRERESSERRLNPRLHEPISKDKIEEALKKMTNEKVEERPDTGRSVKVFG